jgi:acetyl esterase/lipase
MTSDRVTIEENIVFGTGGGQDLLCDVYRPPAATANGLGVLIVFGGGFVGGDRHNLRGYGILLGRSGYLSVCIDHRLAPEWRWPAQLEDAKAAVAGCELAPVTSGSTHRRSASLGRHQGGCSP